MDSSDEEVLLGSCCLLLNFHQQQPKRKRKRTLVQKIFLRIKEQVVYYNFLQEMRVSYRESHFR